MKKVSNASSSAVFDALDPRSCDIRLLSQISHQLKQQDWINDNIDAISMACRDRCDAALKQLIAKHDGNIVIPDYIYNYFRKIEENTRNQHISKATEMTPFVLRIIIYLSEQLGVSAHYLALGTQLPVELFGRTANFLRFMETLSDERVDDIMTLLNQTPFTSNNFIITFRDRCLEAANAQDINDDTLTFFRWGRAYIHKLLEFIFFDNLPDNLEDLVRTPVNRTSGYHLIILRFCLLFNISADFFLLRDYSPFALLDGKPLNEKQRSWLSAYLSATQDAQRKAICKISCWLVDR